MCRKLAYILILLSVIMPPLAATLSPVPYFRQYSSSFTVQLDSTSFFSHQTTATYNSGNSPGTTHNTNVYYQDQELGVVGATGVSSNNESCSVMLTISVPSEWFYTLAGSEYKRPYGLDVFARGKKLTDGTDEDLNIAGERVYTVSLGYQQTTRTKNKGTVIKLFVPKSIVQDYTAVWWDICLVLDPATQEYTETIGDETLHYYYTSLPPDSDTSIEAVQVQPSNQKYFTDFDINLSCWDFDTFEDYSNFIDTEEHPLVNHRIANKDIPIHLEGFFKPEAISEGSGTNTNTNALTVSFSVEKNPGADEIQLLSGTALRTEQIQIATYNLTSSERKKSGNTKPAESGKVYIFISSSSEGYSQGDLFALNHKKDRNSVYSSPFLFNVIMESTASFPGETNPLAHEKGKAASRTVVFDGTTQFSINNGLGQIPNKCMQVEAEVTLQKPPSTWYAQWRDSGNIYIQLTGKVLDYYTGLVRDYESADLVSGEYSANIYIHVVSDIN